jgi:hypothetical protein
LRFFLSLQVWDFEIQLVFGEIQVLGLFSDGRKSQMAWMKNFAQTLKDGMESN